jgi:hypothetical protein
MLSEYQSIKEGIEEYMGYNVSHITKKIRENEAYYLRLLELSNEIPNDDRFAVERVDYEIEDTLACLDRLYDELAMYI